jgi:hypothetical protein
MARPFAVPISQHDPANEKRASHDDQRQQLVLHRRYPLELCAAQLFPNTAGLGRYYDCAVH